MERGYEPSIFSSMESRSVKRRPRLADVFDIDNDDDDDEYDGGEEDDDVDDGENSEWISHHCLAVFLSFFSVLSLFLSFSFKPR